MPVSALAQELWDSVIDYLRDLADDLKVCALVCRSFVPRAQAHLFHTISFAENAVLKDQVAVTKALASISRIAEAFCDSPHLGKYVRHLRVGRSYSDLLRLLAQLRWPRVHTLTFERVLDAKDTLESIKTLVSIPSLQELTFSLAYSAEWRETDFHAFLASCSIGLRVLHLTGSTPSGRTTVHSLNDITLPSRPKIEELRLTQTTRVTELLTHTYELSTRVSFPLDFSELKALEISTTATPDLNRFLQRVGTRIARLRLVASDETLHHLDLSTLPALTVIHTNILDANFIRLLRRASANQISIIRFAVFGHRLAGLQAKATLVELARFEDVVLQCLPVLAQVVIALRTQEDHAAEAVKMQEMVETSMTRLHLKGILSVEVDTQCRCDWR